ncbi:actin-related protein 8 isoform X2 [Phoenix dactylifera]|uniref:Actin-related protein 8 isoform X2 n=1 Tax=Phoenix dactylifera TaxID=42345 RepID=A0A8B7BPY4_PHODC|nr:actin-related protein 8 isoform X2 [Phoenix dactylifera]
MEALLRKVRGSVLSRFGSTSGRSSSESPADHLSMGAFDQLPIDVLVQILRCLGPKEVARTCLVCKSWKLLASDNRLWIFFLQNRKEPWDSVLFSETHLRLGSPSMMYFDQSPQLSFMNIYAMRATIPGSVIIDGGSGYCKYGWSKYYSPSGRCATFLEFGNIESPMYSRLRHFFSTIYSRMQVKASSQPIIISIPICHSEDTESARASRRQLRETIYAVLFDMNVPAVCAIDQAVLALYAAKRTSGIVVNIGFHATSIVPILRGKVMREVGVEIVGQGALKLTGFLRELMQQRNISFESLYTVRTIKEKLCYVASDYEAELCKDTQASCEVASEGWFTLSKERFQTTEILFQPHIGGMRAMGLHQAVALCMDHCFEAEVASDDGWFKTVVLAGGSSCLPGLPERLEKELYKLLPPSMADGIKVIPPPYGTDSAWFGAKIVSNVSTFSEAWCMTKKQFRQKFRRKVTSLIGSW